MLKFSIVKCTFHHTKNTHQIHTNH